MTHTLSDDGSHPRAPGATHRLDSLSRYYGEGYERGDWPWISATLLALLAAPGVERVWYGGDDTDWFDEVTPDFLDRMNRYWIENGNRPYYERLERAAARPAS